MLTELDILAEFDLSLEPPCEALFHVDIGATDSAYFLVRAACPECPHSKTYMVGQECFAAAMKTGVVLECLRCDAVAPTGEFWTVVQVL